jgi:hypothetical protein
MGRRSTPDSLELYLYACNETGLTDSDRIQRAIDGDPLTADDFSAIVQLIETLETPVPGPSDALVSRILGHA